MLSEAMRRDFDAPLLIAAFPGWPVEAAFEMTVEQPGSQMAGRLRCCRELRPAGIVTATISCGWSPIRRCLCSIDQALR